MKLSKIKALFATTLLGIGMVATTALAADLGPNQDEDTYPKTPGYTYTVAGDVDSIDVTATFVGTNDTVSYNDWCGSAIKVTGADGSVTWYGFGGKEVGWNASVEEEDAGEVPAAGGDDFFVIDSATGTGSFSVPVSGAGTTVAFYDLCWCQAENVENTHWTIEVSGDAEAPAVDATEAPADDATEAPAAEDGADATEAPATDNKPATGDSAPIAMVVVVMAAAATALVVMKKKEA